MSQKTLQPEVDEGAKLSLADLTLDIPRAPIPHPTLAESVTAPTAAARGLTESSLGAFDKAAARDLLFAATTEQASPSSARPAGVEPVDRAHTRRELQEEQLIVLLQEARQFYFGAQAGRGTVASSPASSTAATSSSDIQAAHDHQLTSFFQMLKGKKERSSGDPEVDRLMQQIRTLVPQSAIDSLKDELKKVKEGASSEQVQAALRDIVNNLRGQNLSPELLLNQSAPQGKAFAALLHERLVQVDLPVHGEAQQVEGAKKPRVEVVRELSPTESRILLELKKVAEKEAVGDLNPNRTATQFGSTISISFDRPRLAKLINGVLDRTPKGDRITEESLLLFEREFVATYEKAQSDFVQHTLAVTAWDREVRMVALERGAYRALGNTEAVARLDQKWSELQAQGKDLLEAQKSRFTLRNRLTGQEESGTLGMSKSTLESPRFVWDAAEKEGELRMRKSIERVQALQDLEYASKHGPENERMAWGLFTKESNTVAAELNAQGGARGGARADAAIASLWGAPPPPVAAEQFPRVIQLPELPGKPVEVATTKGEGAAPPPPLSTSQDVFRLAVEEAAKHVDAPPGSAAFEGVRAEVERSHLTREVATQAEVLGRAAIDRTRRLEEIFEAHPRLRELAGTLKFSERITAAGLENLSPAGAAKGGTLERFSGVTSVASDEIAGTVGLTPAEQRAARELVALVAEGTILHAMAERVCNEQVLSRADRYGELTPLFLLAPAQIAEEYKALLGPVRPEFLSALQDITSGDERVLRAHGRSFDQLEKARLEAAATRERLTAELGEKGLAVQGDGLEDGELVVVAEQDIPVGELLLALFGVRTFGALRPDQLQALADSNPESSAVQGLLSHAQEVGIENSVIEKGSVIGLAATKQGLQLHRAHATEQWAALEIAAFDPRLGADLPGLNPEQRQMVAVASRVQEEMQAQATVVEEVNDFRETLREAAAIAAHPERYEGRLGTDTPELLLPQKFSAAEKKLAEWRRDPARKELVDGLELELRRAEFAAYMEVPEHLSGALRRAREEFYPKAEQAYKAMLDHPLIKENPDLRREVLRAGASMYLAIGRSFGGGTDLQSEANLYNDLYEMRDAEKVNREVAKNFRAQSEPLYRARVVAANEAFDKAGATLREVYSTLNSEREKRLIGVPAEGRDISAWEEIEKKHVEEQRAIENSRRELLEAVHGAFGRYDLRGHAEAVRTLQEILDRGSALRGVRLGFDNLPSYGEVARERLPFAREVSTHISAQSLSAVREAFEKLSPADKEAALTALGRAIEGALSFQGKEEDAHAALVGLATSRVLGPYSLPIPYNVESKTTAHLGYAYAELYKTLAAKSSDPIVSTRALIFEAKALFALSDEGRARAADVFSLARSNAEKIITQEEYDREARRLAEALGSERNDEKRLGLQKELAELQTKWQERQLLCAEIFDGEYQTHLRLIRDEPHSYQGQRSLARLGEMREESFVKANERVELLTTVLAKMDQRIQELPAGSADQELLQTQRVQIAREIEARGERLRALMIQEHWALVESGQLDKAKAIATNLAGRYGNSMSVLRRTGEELLAANGKGLEALLHESMATLAAGSMVDTVLILGGGVAGAAIGSSFFGVGALPGFFIGSFVTWVGTKAYHVVDRWDRITSAASSGYTPLTWSDTRDNSIFFALDVLTIALPAGKGFLPAQMFKSAGRLVGGQLGERIGLRVGRTVGSEFAGEAFGALRGSANKAFSQQLAADVLQRTGVNLTERQSAEAIKRALWQAMGNDALKAGNSKPLRYAMFAGLGYGMGKPVVELFAGNPNREQTLQVLGDLTLNVALMVLYAKAQHRVETHGRAPIEPRGLREQLRGVSPEDVKSFEAHFNEALANIVKEVKGEAATRNVTFAPIARAEGSAEGADKVRLKAPGEATPADLARKQPREHTPPSERRMTEQPAPREQQLVEKGKVVATISDATHPILDRSPESVISNFAQSLRESDALARELKQAQSAGEASKVTELKERLREEKLGQARMVNENGIRAKAREYFKGTDQSPEMAKAARRAAEMQFELSTSDIFADPFEYAARKLDRRGILSSEWGKAIRMIRDNRVEVRINDRAAKLYEFFKKSIPERGGERVQAAGRLSENLAVHHVRTLLKAGEILRDLKIVYGPTLRAMPAELARGSRALGIRVVHGAVEPFRYGGQKIGEGVRASWDGAKATVQAVREIPKRIEAYKKSAKVGMESWLTAGTEADRKVIAQARANLQSFAREGVSGREVQRAARRFETSTTLEGRSEAKRALTSLVRNPAEVEQALATARRLERGLELRKRAHSVADAWSAAKIGRLDRGVEALAGMLEFRDAKRVARAERIADRIYQQKTRGLAAEDVGGRAQARTEARKLADLYLKRQQIGYAAGERVVESVKRAGLDAERRLYDAQRAVSRTSREAMQELRRYSRALREGTVDGMQASWDAAVRAKNQVVIKSLKGVVAAVEAPGKLREAGTQVLRDVVTKAENKVSNLLAKNTPGERRVVEGHREAVREHLADRTKVGDARRFAREMDHGPSPEHRAAAEANLRNLLRDPAQLEVVRTKIRQLEHSARIAERAHYLSQIIVDQARLHTTHPLQMVEIASGLAEMRGHKRTTRYNSLVERLTERYSRKLAEGDTEGLARARRKAEQVATLLMVRRNSMLALGGMASDRVSGLRRHAAAQVDVVLREVKAAYKATTRELVELRRSALAGAKTSWQTLVHLPKLLPEYRHRATTAMRDNFVRGTEGDLRVVRRVSGELRGLLREGSTIGEARRLVHALEGREIGAARTQAKGRLESMMRDPAKIDEVVRRVHALDRARAIQAQALHAARLWVATKTGSLHQAPRAVTRLLELRDLKRAARAERIAERVYQQKTQGVAADDHAARANARREAQEMAQAYLRRQVKVYALGEGLAARGSAALSSAEFRLAEAQRAAQRAGQNAALTIRQYGRALRNGAVEGMAAIDGAVRKSIASGRDAIHFVGEIPERLVQRIGRMREEAFQGKLESLRRDTPASRERVSELRGELFDQLKDPAQSRRVQKLSQEALLATSAERRAALEGELKNLLRDSGSLEKVHRTCIGLEEARFIERDLAKTARLWVEIKTLQNLSPARFTECVAGLLKARNLKREFRFHKISEQIFAEISRNIPEGDVLGLLNARRRAEQLATIRMMRRGAPGAVLNLGVDAARVEVVRIRRSLQQGGKRVAEATKHGVQKVYASGREVVTAAGKETKKVIRVVSDPQQIVRDIRAELSHLLYQMHRQRVVARAVSIGILAPNSALSRGFVRVQPRSTVTPPREGAPAKMEPLERPRDQFSDLGSSTTVQTIAPEARIRLAEYNTPPNLAERARLQIPTSNGGSGIVLSKELASAIQVQQRQVVLMREALSQSLASPESRAFYQAKLSAAEATLERLTQHALTHAAHRSELATLLTLMQGEEAALRSAGGARGKMGRDAVQVANGKQTAIERMLGELDGDTGEARLDRLGVEQAQELFYGVEEGLDRVQDGLGKLIKAGSKKAKLGAERWEFKLEQLTERTAELKERFVKSASLKEKVEILGELKVIEERVSNSSRAVEEHISRFFGDDDGTGSARRRKPTPEDPSSGFEEAAPWDESPPYDPLADSGDGGRGILYDEPEHRVTSEFEGDHFDEPVPYDPAREDGPSGGAGGGSSVAVMEPETKTKPKVEEDLALDLDSPRAAPEPEPVKLEPETAPETRPQQEVESPKVEGSEGETKSKGDETREVAPPEPQRMPESQRGGDGPSVTIRSGEAEFRPSVEPDTSPLPLHPEISPAEVPQEVPFPAHAKPHSRFSIGEDVSLGESGLFSSPLAQAAGAKGALSLDRRHRLTSRLHEELDPNLEPRRDPQPEPLSPRPRKIAAEKEMLREEERRYEYSYGRRRGADGAPLDEDRRPHSKHPFDFSIHWMYPKKDVKERGSGYVYKRKHSIWYIEGGDGEALLNDELDTSRRYDRALEDNTPDDPTS